MDTETNDQSVVRGARRHGAVAILRNMPREKLVETLESGLSGWAAKEVADMLLAPSLCKCCARDLHAPRPEADL